MANPSGTAKTPAAEKRRRKKIAASRRLQGNSEETNAKISQGVMTYARTHDPDGYLRGLAATKRVEHVIDETEEERVAEFERDMAEERDAHFAAEYAERAARIAERHAVD